MATSHSPLALFTLRSRILFSMEQYFQSRGYISVQTPALATSLIPERHIEVFELANNPTRYLIPSPERYLKPLLYYLAQEDTGEDSLPNVYEFSHSFRKGEVQDSIHNDEFLMLEWYTSHATLEDSMQHTIKLIYTILETLVQNKSDGLQYTLPLWAERLLQDRSEVLVMSVEEAFAEYANINLSQLIACETTTQAVTCIEWADGQEHTSWNDWEELFHFLLVDRVEPKIPKDTLVFLTHYPVRVATLAKSSDNSSRNNAHKNLHKNVLWSERFELYIQGVEIANGYVEETGVDLIKEFFLQQKESISQGNDIRVQDIPLPNEFLQNDFPSYSGVALGVDRVVLSILSAMVDEKKLSQISPLAFFQ